MLSKLGRFLVLPALLLFPSVLKSQIREYVAEPRQQQTQRVFQALSARHTGRPFITNPSFSSTIKNSNAEGTGSIAGLVTGLQDMDYYSAWVEAFTAESADNGEYYKGISNVDSSGCYQIDGLAPGKYYVMAFAEGYDIIYYDNVFDLAGATPVGVTANEITEKIDFRMQKWPDGAGSISGQVLRADDETPLANVFVSCYSPDQPYWNSAVTDAQGNYSIKALRAADYVVQAWAEGYLEQYYFLKDDYMEADLVALADSADVTAIDFSLQKAGSISGYVTDEAGRPLALTYLYAEPFADSIGWSDPAGGTTKYDRYGKAESDENGHYIINGLTDGDYRVHAEMWLYWGYAAEWYENKPSPQEADKVRVITGQETTDINFSLAIAEPKGVIFGNVSDTEGRAIENAYVNIQTADPSNPMPVWTSVVTDKEGNYRLDRLPNGSYYVSAGISSSWQYIQRWWPDAESLEEATPVVVDDSVEPQPIDFILPIVIGTSTISGQVLNTEGHPLVWASINITPAAPSSPETGNNGSVWAWASTDSSGFYSVSQLPEGEYVAYASYWQDFAFGQQWWDQQESRENANVIDLAKDEKRTDINFTLFVKPVFGSITGTVTDATSGKPVERAFISILSIYLGMNQDILMPFTRPFFWYNTYAISDKNGFFAIDWLYEGDYLVSVYADGAFEYFEKVLSAESATPVKVVGGEKSVVNFNLSPRQDGSAVIAGRVVSEWEKMPFDIAVISAKPTESDSDVSYTAVTDSLGYFQLQGLPENSDFIIYAFSGYAVGEYYDNVYDPALATIVKTTGSDVTTLNDIELPFYAWCYYDGAEKNSPSNAQIFGRATDGQGNGLVGVHIVIFNEAGQAVATAQTGFGGYYEVGGLTAGNYILQASFEGFSSIFNGNVSTMRLAQPVNIGANTLQIDFVLEPTGVVSDNDGEKLPDTPVLLGNYPNPFNPDTQIAFVLPSSMETSLTVYNLKGEQVALLFSGKLESGRHEIVWDGRNQAGQQMSSGLYVYKLNADEMTLTGKMLMLK